MKHRTKINTLLILLIIIIPFYGIANAQEQSWALGPALIRLPDALKGSTYQQTLLIYNNNNFDGNLSLNTTGEIKDWITFHETMDTSPYYNTTPINSVFIPKNSIKKIMLLILIPENAANGDYNGTIELESIREETNESEGKVTASLFPSSIVYINVTGEQNLNISLEQIQVEDVEIGFSSKILAVIENTGNVVASPTIDVQFTKNDQIMSSISSEDYSFASIQPTQVKTYNMQWNTADLARAMMKWNISDFILAGDYTAHFSIILDEEIVEQQNVTFEIFRQETLQRNGTLEDINYEGEPKKGEPLTIVATFKNIGEIDLIAQFHGELYKDGKIINDSILSPETLVKKYNQANFEIELITEENGEYLIKGYVSYDDEIGYQGGKTEQLELKFTLGSTLLSIEFNQILVIGILIAAIIMVLVYVLHKKQFFAKIIPQLTPQNWSFNTKKKKKTKAKKINKSKSKKKRIRVKRNKEKSPLRKLHKKLKK